MRRLFSIAATFLIAVSASADEIEWRPAAPIQTPPNPEPAAKLGPLAPLPKSAPDGTDRPQELPAALAEPAGPTLPPLRAARPVVVIPPPQPASRATKELFASDVSPVPTPMPAANPTQTKPFTPAKVSVQPGRPQPWAPRPGQRTIISELFAR